MIGKSWLVVVVTSIFAASSQSQDKAKPVKLVVSPSSVKMEIGDTAQLKATLVDADGKPVKGKLTFYSLARRSVTIDQTGKVRAARSGSFNVTVLYSQKGGKPLRQSIKVVVAKSPVTLVRFLEPRNTMYQNTSAAFSAEAIDSRNKVRSDVTVKLTSSDPKIASIDEHGYLTAHRLGEITLTAQAGKIQSKLAVNVVPNPVATFQMEVGQKEARTGDVLHFNVIAKDKAGKTVADLPVTYTFFASPKDNLGPGASGQIEHDGRFVAEKPGVYTIVANSGMHTALSRVKMNPRNVGMSVKLVGHAPVRHVHTSDLWVWTGKDGRDYCVTGTWVGSGEAYFWDVTDPKNMKKIFTIKVDARTVNDVKISQDGQICVISREGASNRKNGLVILDVSDPRNVKILSKFDDELTGGVHNVFIYKDHVFAVNNARRYDIINIKDPKKPHRVGRFELDTPGHSLHDVWVVDGIAYSSNWRDGVVLVDVGNGVAGGTPENPVKIGSYAYSSGWNHAAFPYKSKTTGKFYVIAGDEAFPTGLYKKNTPTIPAGWIHFIDFTNPKKPKEVARYEVPEAGTHNMWVEGDKLYVAYYNGGLRVVDISGELMGDLYRQGREIAKFVPWDPKGVVPNSGMTWGPQPHKGVVFLSDWNSGLWSVRLAPKTAKSRK